MKYSGTVSSVEGDCRPKEMLLLGESGDKAESGEVCVTETILEMSSGE
jgi:hypothetical protein